MAVDIVRPFVPFRTTTKRLIISRYLLSFLDRANIGNARLAGMEADLNMSGKRKQPSVKR